MLIYGELFVLSLAERGLDSRPTLDALNLPELGIWNPELRGQEWYFGFRITNPEERVGVGIALM